jgi:hypothetical protein
LFEGHGGDVKQPPELALEDHLAELLEQKRALDDQRNALLAEILTAREQLRAERHKHRHLEEPPPSTNERKRIRLAQIQRLIETGESSGGIAQRLQIGARHARRIMSEARALAPESLSTLYKCEEWTAAFEAEVLRLRPHFPRPLLSAMGSLAWTRYGLVNEEPIGNAAVWSANFELPQKSIAAKAGSAAMGKAKPPR